jgi:hypothetical protein
MFRVLAAPFDCRRVGRHPYDQLRKGADGRIGDLGQCSNYPLTTRTFFPGECLRNFRGLTPQASGARSGLLTALEMRSGWVYGAQELHELLTDLGRRFMLDPVAHIVEFEAPHQTGKVGA